MNPALVVNDLARHFVLRRPGFRRPALINRAVDGVSFELQRSETLALVGESGCGKSTVARMLMRLVDPTAGQVVLAGRRIDDLAAGALAPYRRHIQLVFQDPFSSLNPRMRVRRILAEPLRNFGLATSSADVDARVEALLAVVGLPDGSAGRYPHEFSGGQRQRIGIARALAAEPDVLVCDEAVSALDVSVKAQIVNLLGDLQARIGLALLFISHDLAIVEHFAHRVAVMYLGRIVEIGSRRQIFAAPRHPYTAALVAAVPRPDPDARRTQPVLQGDPASALAMPAGCRFQARCPAVQARCRSEDPALTVVSAEHQVACHFPLQ